MSLTQEYRGQLARIARQAESVLAENLMPFWANNTWDEKFGGFLTRLDRYGRRLEAREKVLMMQVRMIAALAGAHRHGLRDRGYLERAAQGVEYLINTFWDKQQGGFYFSVARDNTPNSTRKNTDFHAYVMTGLTEYYLASGHTEALAWADRVFELLLEKAADRDRGFIEDFDGDVWPALNAEQMVLGDQRHIKTIDMHANVLEGMMYLAGASGNERHRQLLRALLDLICEDGIYKEHGCTITAFDGDWRPLCDARGRRTTSYGLNVELAWFIWEAALVLNEPCRWYHQKALRLLDHALLFGYDCKRGGLAAYGPITGNVLHEDTLGDDRLNKSWWAQAELLNALGDAFRYTGEPRYLEALQQSFDWIYHYQIDHECGDWYQDVQWDTGMPLTMEKGREFKTAFHAGRALQRTSKGLASRRDK